MAQNFDKLISMSIRVLNKHGTIDVVVINFDKDGVPDWDTAYFEAPYEYEDDFIGIAE